MMVKLLNTEHEYIHSVASEAEVHGGRKEGRQVDKWQSKNHLVLKLKTCKSFKISGSFFP
jgi:hypothetical protein